VHIRSRIIINIIQREDGKIDNPRAGKLRSRSSGFLGNLAERKGKKKEEEEKGKEKRPSCELSIRFNESRERVQAGYSK